jgi:hypothetical protein
VNAASRDDRERTKEMNEKECRVGRDVTIPVGDGELLDSGTKELDKLLDDALGAESLGDGEHQIGGGDVRGELARELVADDLGEDHRDGLIEHHTLGFDTADTPSHDAETWKKKEDNW